jgi:hypothetical protein
VQSKAGCIGNPATGKGGNHGGLSGTGQMAGHWGTPFFQMEDVMSYGLAAD